MSQGQMTTCVNELGLPEVLVALQQRGDHYGLLSVALRHLADRTDDDATILLSCQSYVALGLIGPARDLLRGAGREARCRAELDALGQQIARAPSGRVGWRSMQGRFESNASRLYERYPEMREHDATFRALPRRYELYRTIDGNFHIAKRLPGNRREWLDGLCDVNGAVAHAQLPHNRNASFCGPYLIAGDRWGAFFDRVFDATEKMFLTFSPRIFVIDTNVVAFGATLYVSESVERFCHERTDVFVGPDCVERLSAHLETHTEQNAPEFAVSLTATGKALSQRAHDALQPRAAALERKHDRTLDALRRHYDSLPPGQWRERFRPDRKHPLRVLGLTSRFTTYLQYSMRDWGTAFEARGDEFQVLLEDNDHDLLPRARTAEVLEQYKPDLIVIIDHLRHEYGSAIPANVPLVCWIQDLLPNLTTKEAGRSLGPMDFYIAPDPATYVQQYGYPVSQGLPWTMATDCRTYDNQPLPEAELAPYRCDLSYVSNHSAVPQKFHDERRAWFASDVAALSLVDHLFDTLERSSESLDTVCGAGPRFLERVKEETELAPVAPETEKSVLHNYVHPLAELMFRQSALGWVADYCDRTGRTLNLYGNGWDAHPRFGKYARGFAQNGRELRAIYQASTINLQIIGTGAVHQRLLDGLAAGAFFLIRSSPGDRAHEPVQQLLAAIRKCEPELETTYTAEQMPELAAAVEAFWRLRGIQDGGREFQITQSAFDSYLEMEAGGYRRCAAAVFGRYEDVVFSSAQAFERVAGRYLDDAPQRAQVAASMREAVVDKFTYGALVDELLAFIGKRMAELTQTH